MEISRRHWLQVCSLGIVSYIQSRLFGATPPAPTARFAVSSWSFHNYFEGTRYGKPEFKPEKWWTIEQVVSAITGQIGVKNIELSSAHLASFEPKYLAELNTFMTKVDAKFCHLSDNMRNVNLAKNAADVDKFIQLIDVAKALHIPSMRVNTGDGNINDVIPRLGKLAEYGQKAGVEIVIENHFGISADPQNVAKIISAVGKNISSCPDFGLLPKDDSRWSGLETMFKHSMKVCSAKFHGLELDGKHPAFDLKRCYEALRKAGFPGFISFEYEGNLEPVPQLQLMKKLATAWLG